MAVNLATKFQSKTSDILVHEAKTNGIVNNNYEWSGAGTIVITTLVTPTIGNYNRTASANRFGTPAEVQDTQQTWVLARDRSFSAVIDQANMQDSAEGVRKAGKYVALAVKEKLVPEIDTFRLAALVTAGGVARSTTILAAGATTSANAYTNFLTLNANRLENEASETGAVALMTPSYYNNLKLSGFIVASEIAMNSRQTGKLGEIDNCKIVVVPPTRMPANTDLVITHPSVMTAPEKIKTVKIHDDAPGFGGSLIEYRHRYDAFVDTNQLGQLAIHKTV